MITDENPERDFVSSPYYIVTVPVKPFSSDYGLVNE